MDKKIIFIKTAKGGDEFKNKTSLLSGDYKRVLGLVDDKSTVEELTKRAAPSLRVSFSDMLQKLENDGFIQRGEGNKESQEATVDSPPLKPSKLMLKMAIPVATPERGDLDFTSIIPTPDQGLLVATQAKAKQATEAKALADAETARLKAEQEAARVKAELAATQAKAKQATEAKALADAETARLKAEQEAARVKAELVATQAKAKQAAEAKALADAETARLKAEQEAARVKAELAATQAKAKQATEAKALADAETARLKAEQEADRVKAELAKTTQTATQEAVDRASAGAHNLLPQDQAAQAKSDEEARLLTESQSKIWAEAEQRARVLAQQANEALQKTQITEKVAPTPVVPRASKKPRQPLAVGKIFIGMMGLFVVLSLLLPFVWPMQEYISKFEQHISAQLHQPVHIGQMRAKLLPLPKLELQSVSVGGKEELRAENVVLNFSVLDLFTDTKVISRMEISGLTLKAESFTKTLSWIQAAGGVENYPVAQIALFQARVTDAGLNLPSINGEIDFNGQGSLVKAVMSSEDRKFSMELRPQQSRWQLVVNIKESNLPLFPAIPFDELHLKGEISPNEARFSEVEGRFYKGKVLGKAWLTWASGWEMSGQIAVTALSLQSALPQLGLNGDLDGKASFARRGTSLALLAQTPRLDGSISIKKGFMDGIDMVETARLARRQGVSAGRTNFDEMSGTLTIDGGGVQIQQIKISAGILSGNGLVAVTPGNQLSGRINVDLKIRADMGITPLILSGTPAKPTWRTGR